MSVGLLELPLALLDQPLPLTTRGQGKAKRRKKLCSAEGGEGEKSACVCVFAALKDLEADPTRCCARRYQQGLLFYLESQRASEQLDLDTAIRPEREASSSLPLSRFLRHYPTAPFAG